MLQSRALRFGSGGASTARGQWFTAGAVKVGVADESVEGGHLATAAASGVAIPAGGVASAIMRLGGRMPLADAALVLLPVVFAVAIVQMVAEDTPREQKIPSSTFSRPRRRHT